jgi:hypothetical protein
VFSDEFEESGRGFTLKDRDPRWTAVDIQYSRDNKEAQNYKPDAITTEDGALKITISKETTTGGFLTIPASWAELGGGKLVLRTTTRTSV